MSQSVAVTAEVSPRNRKRILKAYFMATTICFGSVVSFIVSYYNTHMTIVIMYYNNHYQ